MTKVEKNKIKLFWLEKFGEKTIEHFALFFCNISNFNVGVEDFGERLSFEVSSFKMKLQFYL